MQCRVNAADGSFTAELRHSAPRLHREGVVQMRLQFTHDHFGLLQVCAARVEANFLAAGLARFSFAAFANHGVRDVAAAAGVRGRFP